MRQRHRFADHQVRSGSNAIRCPTHSEYDEVLHRRQRRRPYSSQNSRRSVTWSLSRFTPWAAPTEERHLAYRVFAVNRLQIRVEAERRHGESTLVARERSHLSALVDLLNQLGRRPRANARADHVLPRVNRRQNATAAARHFHCLVVPVPYRRHLSLPRRRGITPCFSKYQSRRSECDPWPVSQGDPRAIPRLIRQGDPRVIRGSSVKEDPRVIRGPCEKGIRV
jgi:hypothetical protein